MACLVTPTVMYGRREASELAATILNHPAKARG